ncbi:sortase [Candidatus Microgenomates bacterium]|nr:sortase [Candidatus Microgenomates bacterium]
MASAGQQTLPSQTVPETLASDQPPGPAPVIEEPSAPTREVAPKPPTPPVSSRTSFLQSLKLSWQNISAAARKRLGLGTKQPLPSRVKPVIGAVLVGFLIFAIFNSQVILGQIKYLISPGTEAEAPAVVDASTTVPPEPIIIIPKININVPVVYDEPSFDEKAVQKALERGIVHYGTTGVPGQPGNNVIVGHSSNNWWASGKYKFAFVLLNKLEAGDTFVLNYNSKRYVYEVFSKRIVEPTDLSILDQNTPQPIATLVTCDPPGTSWKRLAVQARQISPDPSKSQGTAPTVPSQIDSPLPGNTPSVIDKIRDWISG